MIARTFVTLVGAVMLLGVVVCTPLEATEFYRGKTVELLTHAPPGGAYDLNARLLARHLPKHIPGSPTVVVKNMPGGGGLIQANYLYARGKADGTTIGILVTGVPKWKRSGCPASSTRATAFSGSG